MADNPFASLGLQQMGREGRFVGQTFGGPMNDIKKLAGAYAFDKSGLKDWANRTFGTPPPTGLEKPQLLPDQMTGAPGFGSQTTSGMGLTGGGGQGFNLGVAPPPAMPSAPSSAPMPNQPVPMSTGNVNYDMSTSMPTNKPGSSMFDDAMEVFGFKRFGG